MAAFETIVYEKSGGVAHVVLNRPGVVNVYNMRMRDELYQVLEAVRDDTGVRVMILRGAGEKGFCAGADLTEFGTAPSQAIARRVRWERDVWGLFLSISKPIITALHGYVLGSGVEMALLCDVRIASEDAVFGMPEVALGMIPAAGGTQTLPRNIGISRSLELLLISRRIDAREALRWGLVHKVVPKERLLVEAGQVAMEMASRRPVVVGAAKEAIKRGLEMPMGEALSMEDRLALGVLQGTQGDKEGDEGCI